MTHEWITKAEALVSQADKLQGRYEAECARLSSVRKEIKALRAKMELLETARALIQQVAQDTQARIEVHLSELVTVALRAIFPDPYVFRVCFVQRRGRTEVDLTLQRGDKGSIDPMSSVGGGVIDVLSFALRICFWSLMKGRVSNTIILDEPFRYFNDPTRQMQQKAGTLLKELSGKLQCQFIVVSMIDELALQADRVFLVSQTHGVSQVRKVDHP